MIRLRRRPIPQTRRDGDADERVAVFLSFWIIAGLVLLALGIATFVALHHGHRVGLALAALSAPCLVVAYLIRRAQRRPE